MSDTGGLVSVHPRTPGPALLRRPFREWAKGDWHEIGPVVVTDGALSSVLSVSQPQRSGPSTDLRRGERRCALCEQWKALDAFPSNPKQSQGRGYECRECKRAVDEIGRRTLRERVVAKRAGEVAA